MNLLFEHLRGVADSANDTQTTRIRHRSSQLGAGRNVHTCQQDGVVDLQEISERGTEELCSSGISNWWHHLLAARGEDQSYTSSLLGGDLRGEAMAETECTLLT